MREIKFRAWDKVRKRWYRTELEWKGFSIFGELMYSGLPNMNDLPNIVLQQYTGLKDKNGIEIYEGDVFRIEEEHEDRDTYNWVVITWVNEWCMFCALLIEEHKDYKLNGISVLDEPMFWTYTLEDTNDKKYFLCGNIYENPELLEE